MKALVVGAKGNLGQDLVLAFRKAGHDVTGADREDLDVTDAASVRSFVSGGGFDAVVNAVAWNDVDGAEDPAKRPLAWALNVDAPRVLAEASNASGAAFVHYSTDYVFEGMKEEGYREDDEAKPISAYGASKLAGERAVAETGGRWYVCRLSKIFGRPGVSATSKPGFLAIMHRLAREKPELSIVDDEVGSPSYTVDIAEATVKLLTEAFPPGIYHLVNEGPGVTWYGFAEEFFGLAGVTTPRKPVPASLFPKPAQRPKSARLLNTTFPPLRSRAEALKAFIDTDPEMR